MRGVTRVSALVAAAALAVGLGSLGFAGVASADDVSAVSTAPLPFAPTITGALGSTTITVTLPSSGTPTRLTGTIRSAFTVPGTIVVTANGRTVASVDAQTGGDVDAALSAEDLSQGVVAVGMRAIIDPTRDCFTDTTSTATLVDGLVTYTHPVKAPSSIGSFLTDGLSSVTVQVPAEPTAAEQQAGLDAVAALVRRYAPPTVIRLVASDATPTFSYLDRVVVVREGDPPAASGATSAASASTSASGAAASSAGDAGTFTLTPPGYLTVSAPADALASAAVALSAPTLKLVESTVINNVAGTPAWSPERGTTTLAQLGTGPISLSAVGTTQAVLGLNQPAFGGAVNSFALHIQGTVTPLPANATGRIDFLWNGTLVESRDMTSTTVVSEDISIGAAQLARNNTLAVVLSYVPATGECSPPPLAARLDIDPAQSTVTPTFGASVSPGFGRFPQVLGPTATFAFGPEGTLPTLLAQAGDLLAGLAAGTPEQLTTQVVSTSALAASSGPGIVVGADSAMTDSLGAPISVGAVTQVRDTDAVFHGSIEGPLAVAQAYEQNGRDLVLVGPIPSDASDTRTVAAVALTSDLAAQAATEPQRWSLFTGQVMALDATGNLTEVPLPPAGTSGFSTLSFLAIGLIVTGILVASVIVWTMTRPKDPPPPVPGASTS